MQTEKIEKFLFSRSLISGERNLQKVPIRKGVLFYSHLYGYCFVVDNNGSSWKVIPRTEENKTDVVEWDENFINDIYSPNAIEYSEKGDVLGYRISFFDLN